jgi:NAD(P)H-hydrate epimerase
MERAGAGLADLVQERAPTGRIAVVCGKGNNGGDGLVAARLLREWGRDVDVLLLAGRDELRGDAAANLERLPGSPPRAWDPAGLDGAAGVVDAVLGTGFAGEPREPVRGAIDAINRSGAVVLAADVPSGVDASTGEVAGAAVRATATATFHAAKPGLWIHPGKACAGEVRVVEIGIPPGAPAAGDAGVGLIGRGVAALVPSRAGDSTKFSSGAVVLCGGSRGLTGAPCLAAEAAMRTGAGYVTALVPASLQTVFEGRLLEVMTRGLPDDDGALTDDGIDAALEACERADALILGPGLGRDAPTQALARQLARRATLPLLLDADGLNAHAGALGDLAGRAAASVLTPHAGELARLLGCESADVAARRLASARDAAERSAAVVVLKGDDTIVAAPGGPVAVSRGGAPALATAGTGDVLSGITGALLAKGLAPFEAACAAVALHAEAGRIVARPHGPDGVIARDVIAAIPAALAAERAR